MKEIFRKSLIITIYMIFVIGVGNGLLFLVGLIAEVGSIILTLLAAVVAMFIFVFSIIAILRFIERFTKRF